jgi:hypothetical protein
MKRLSIFVFVLLLLSIVIQAAGPIGGFAIPDVNAEKQTYRDWGWTWNANAEPAAVKEPISGFKVSNPDIHYDTEGDDLWTNLMQYLRTGNTVYLNRATAWATYFKHDFRACVGTSNVNFCYDRDNFGGCHLWGWGLVAWYEYNGDAAALTEAESLAAVVERLYQPGSPFGCLPNNGCTHYGIRQISRHLLLTTRVAEATGNKTRWVALRDSILAKFMRSGEWDNARGMYFEGQDNTDYVLGAGHWAAGDRIQSAFQIGWATEAFSHIYRITGRQDVKNRMIAMARFVEQYGLDSTYQYSSSSFGIVGGKPFQSYHATATITFWDPVYTTSLVNTLVWGYKLTGERHFYDSAKKFFNRGTKGIYGSATQRECADNVCGHFQDTKFSSASGYFYYDNNKGELQYTWAMFESPAAVEKGAVRNIPEMRIEASPNPFNSRVTLTLPKGAASAIVYDVSGHSVAELHASGGTPVNWEPKNLSAGVYVVKVRAGKQLLSRKIFLNR